MIKNALRADAPRFVNLHRSGPLSSVTKAALLGFALAFGVDFASAQQPERRSREEELERLVRELSERVSQLEQRLQQVESGQPATFAPEQDAGLQERVDELEHDLEQMKASAPPSEGSTDWTRMREVLDWYGKSGSMRAFWKDGLHFETMDKSFSLKIGGRIQQDWAYLEADDEIERTVGNLDDGAEFRRARIYVSGEIYDRFNFKVQYDFAGGDADFKDVYMGVSDVPLVGNVRIGHFKEAFSLQELTSSNYNTFMERSTPVEAFAPSRNTGIGIFNTAFDERMTWAVGFFRDTDDFGDGSGGRDYNVTTRVTALPWYADDGRQLVHVGVGYTHKNYGDDMARFRSRPEAHQAPRFVDTFAFPAEYADIVAAELAAVWGPFSIQGEYIQAWVESRLMSDPTFWGTYIQGSYFLTGEHRPYKRSTATFDRVRPKRNLGEDGGLGAWEVAARYSHLDLNDHWIIGGELREMTFGLNWYWNPNMRVMWNYVRADLKEGGDANIFQMRFQVNF